MTTQSTSNLPADLPPVDEHSVVIAASPEDVWAAVNEVDRAFSGGAATAYARLVGCADASAAGPRLLAEGSSFPGFRVASAVPPCELVLVGRHRFSSYALIFRIEALDGSRARLTAESRADFPGLAGLAYRTLVIGTRGHVVAVRRLLSSIRRAAEHRARANADVE